jgi:hypothetical protein
MSWKRQVPARYQMLPKKSKLRYQKQLEKFTREWKPVSERQWAKNDEGGIEQNNFFLWTINLKFCNYKNRK